MPQKKGLMKLRKIIIKCKNCHEIMAKMGVRFYGYTSLLDNFEHILEITCPNCRLVNYVKNVFKEDE